MYQPLVGFFSTTIEAAKTFFRQGPGSEETYLTLSRYEIDQVPRLSSHDPKTPEGLGSATLNKLIVVCMRLSVIAHIDLQKILSLTLQKQDFEIGANPLTRIVELIAQLEHV